MRKANQPGVVGILWRSFITGIGYVLFVMIGDTLTRLAGLSAPIMAGMSGKVTPNQILFNLFLSGVLIGLILGPLSLKLPLSYGRRMGLLFFIFYGINTVIIIVETIFFTTMSGEKYTLVSNAISSAGMAALIAMLFRPSDSKLLFSTALRKAIAQRSWVSNLWRFGLAGFLYLPIFFIFGLLSGPFVRTYYEDPAYGINQLFSIPGAEIIFPLEIFRGYLFVLVLYPLIAILGRNMSRWRQWFWIALILASLSGWLPMLMASFFPLPFRLIHGLEVTLDSIVFGAVIVWLLGFEPGKDNQPMDAAS
jgi:hypothetical protein